MAKHRSDNGEDESSPSEHTPAGSETDSGPDDGSQSGDPAQDRLVGEISLDDRFNEGQLSRLVLSKDEYRRAGKKERGEIAFRLGDAFVKEMVRDGVDVPESKRAVVLEVLRSILAPIVLLTKSHWFQNVKLWLAQRARTRREPLQWNVHWSARLVFHKENQDLVRRTQMRLYQEATGKVEDHDDETSIPQDEEVPDSGELPTDKPLRPFHFLQRAISAEFNDLSSKEQKAYEEKATLWRGMGPSHEVQCGYETLMDPYEPTTDQIGSRSRMAEQHAARTIRGFAHNLFRQMGVRLFMLASWEDSQGKIISGEYSTITNRRH